MNAEIQTETVEHDHNRNGIIPDSPLRNCGSCGKSFDVSLTDEWRTMGMLRKLMSGADSAFECPECKASREAAEEERKQRAHDERRRARAREKWPKRVPPDYQRADEAKIPPALRPALSWAPAGEILRLGIYGPPGTGKSMVLALLLRKLEIPFRWVNGFAARSLYIEFATSNQRQDWSGEDDSADWDTLMNEDLLVLDDIDKGNFTDSWASALFDLLETRNSLRRPVIWTANHGPGGLAAKFAKCGDQDLADSLERRLCSGALLIKASL